MIWNSFLRMNQIWKKNPATHRSMEDGERGRQNKIFRENFLKES